MKCFSQKDPLLDDIPLAPTHALAIALANANALANALALALAKAVAIADADAHAKEIEDLEKHIARLDGHVSPYRKEPS